MPNNATISKSTSFKSNSLYEGYSRVQKEIKQGSDDSVPLHLRNPVTPLMKEEDYGKGYKYAHDYPEHFVEQQNLPDALQGKVYYSPGELGYEKQIVTRLKNWWRGKKKAGGTDEEAEEEQEED